MRPDTALFTPQDAADRLDPENWDEFVQFCGDRLQHLAQWMATQSDEPVYSPVTRSVRRAIAEEIPQQAHGLQQACDDLENYVLPHLAGNTHPRYFGPVQGAGTAGNVLAAMYAAAMNANVVGDDHAPARLEESVVSWFLELYGFPTSAMGLFTSDMSMATAVALSTARNRYSSVDVKRRGVRAESMPMIGYTSVEADDSIARCFAMLGLGSEQLRRIPVNTDFTIDTELLQSQIAEDRAAGMLPFCVVGVAGTARTGAVDDMLTLAHICRESDLWFHVDGSHGAMAILSDEFRTALTGAEFADSLAFELHSWLHVMYDSACVLVRDGSAYSDTYASGESRPRDDDAVRNIGMRHFNPGPERARGFRALGAWFAIKEQGLARLGRNVTRNCYQARYLRHLIDRHPNLELRAPVSLNTVCFRYRMPAMSDAELNTLNSRLVGLIRESGVAVVSQTEIGESLVIRVNITNHRTRSADLQLLVATMDELAPVALSSMVNAADQSPP